MKKIFFLLAFFLFCFSCQQEHKTDDLQWTVFNDKNKIPIEIMDYFAAFEGIDLRISNPNEKYNVTDVKQYENAPFRQLRLLEKKNNLWRLVYIQGGIGKSFHFYEFKIQGDTISNIRKGNSLENIETNDSLEYYIKKGKVNFSEIKLKYKFE